MPAFKKFGPGDLLDNVLILEPRYELASGSAGWRGGPAGSSSISLYGGTRSAAGAVSLISYQPILQGSAQFGPIPRSVPQTSSVQLVWMSDTVVASPNSTVWGEEHFSTVMRLYDHYSSQDADYVTGTYDYYSLYFQKDSGNVLTGQGSLIGPAQTITGSFTIEAWVKPFLTSSAVHDFTIASVSRMFTFGITGSNGTLLFSSSAGAWTGTMGPAERRWSHVSVAYDQASRTGSFTVNLLDAGTFTMAPLTASNSYTGSLIVGGQWGSGSLSGKSENIAAKIIGAANRSFHGMVGETRFWRTRRSWTQLSSSMTRTLTGSDLNDSFASFRLVEGPLASFGSSNIRTITAGSGCIDYAALNQVSSGGATAAGLIDLYGLLWSFDDRVGPVWLPNDNVSFSPPKNPVSVPPSGSWSVLAGSSASFWMRNQSVDRVRRMLVVDIPQAFYGRQIVPGSVVMTDRAYSSGSYGLLRVLVDDGRGGLYISGSMCSSSIAQKEDYAGVGWNKVGNVFYGEGLVVIKEPALLDFGRTDGFSSHPNDTFQLSFRGTSRVPVKTLMCRMDPGEFNCTLNPTFWREAEDGRRDVRHPSASIRISTVGIYNSQREIVAVARLAEPIRKRPRDRINIKLRMDF